MLFWACVEIIGMTLNKRILSGLCFNYKWVRSMINSVIREEKGVHSKSQDGHSSQGWSSEAKCTPCDCHKYANFK